MAKTIKFNLICDDKPVRTIVDLQNNFSIEDVLSYYNNKLLHRWLSVRGYNKELDEVSAIVSENSIEITRKLIIIFNVACDEKKVKESIYMLEYLNERKKLCASYEKENYRTQAVIDDYATGYRQLIRGIIENRMDVAMIKASIAEIVKNYEWILKLNYRRLFYKLANTSHLALMCLLMNEKSRNYYFPISATDENGMTSTDVAPDSKNYNFDKEFIYGEICKFIVPPSFRTYLGDNLHVFSGITDGYWKDLEPKGKKYMIISMERGDFIRSSGKSGDDLGYDDILNQFVIVDGIDYKSNYALHELLYMEV